jgi:hypothetical protein
MAIMLLEGLGKLKKSKDIIGNQKNILTVCSIIPQTTLPREPNKLRV